MKFKVSKSYFDSLKIQMKHFEQEGVISQDQEKQILMAYEPARGVNLIRLISVVGSILIGLGILSYIAGNWQNISPVVRMGLIVIGMTGFYLTGMQLDSMYPKTGRALRYIALFIFGGGLFLTDQTFHLNRPVAFHFIIWALGIVVVMQFEKDNLLLYYFQALLFATSIALFDSMGLSKLEHLAYILVLGAGLFLSIRLSDYHYKTYFSAFASGLSLVFFLMTLMVHFELEALYFCSVLLLTGGYFMFKPPIGRYAEPVMSQLGLVVLGFSGFFLTFSDIWSDGLPIDGTAPSIAFTIVFMLGLFYLVKREFIGAIAFIALIIMRFYFDTFYDFMPKSLFFVIGGGILIGFGLYLERVRRKGMDLNA